MSCCKNTPPNKRWSGSNFPWKRRFEGNISIWLLVLLGIHVSKSISIFAWQALLGCNSQHLESLILQPTLPFPFGSTIPSESFYHSPIFPTNSHSSLYWFHWEVILEAWRLLCCRGKAWTTDLSITSLPTCKRNFIFELLSLHLILSKMLLKAWDQDLPMMAGRPRYVS